MESGLGVHDRQKPRPVPEDSLVVGRVRVPREDELAAMSQSDLLDLWLGVPDADPGKQGIIRHMTDATIRRYQDAGLITRGRLAYMTKERLFRHWESLRDADGGLADFLLPYITDATMRKYGGDR